MLTFDLLNRIALGIDENVLADILIIFECYLSVNIVSDRCYSIDCARSSDTMNLEDLSVGEVLVCQNATIGDCPFGN